MTISILPVDTKGIRSGDPTLTSSNSTPNISANLAPMSASKPTSSFFSLYFASGGKPGLTPIFKTPDFNISSNDLAWALNVNDKKIRTAKNDLISLLNMLVSFLFFFLL